MSAPFCQPSSIRNLGRSAALLVAALATGCSTVPTPRSYGNHVVASPDAINQKLANDTVKQLVALYPPASTQFNIAQPVADSFGVTLVAGLREKGYAVKESGPTDAPTTVQPLSRSVEAMPRANGQTDSLGLELQYLVDRPAAGQLYRLSMTISGRSLSRAYLVQNDVAAPAGAWVRKE